MPEGCLQVLEMVASRKFGHDGNIHVADGEMVRGLGQGGQGLGKGVDEFAHLADFILLLSCQVKESGLFIMQQGMEMTADLVQPFDILVLHVLTRVTFSR